MSFHIEPLDANTFEIEIQGKLKENDYRSFVPLAETAIERHGKISLLLKIHDFDGWDPSAMWADLKFDVKHYTDVDKLAIVAQDDSKSWMATVSKPFTAAEVKFFSDEKLEEARRWVQ